MEKQTRALKDLVFDERPVRVDGVSVTPRCLFATLAEPRLRFPATGTRWPRGSWSGENTAPPRWP